VFYVFLWSCDGVKFTVLITGNVTLKVTFLKRRKDNHVRDAHEHPLLNQWLTWFAPFG
jgi:hypothetical protein